MRGSARAVACAAVAIGLGAGAGCRRHARPPAAGRLAITVTDGPGGPPIAARVLFRQGGKPVHFGRNDLYGGVRQVAGACPLGTDALATWAGLALAHGRATVDVGAGDRCRLAPGRYQVWAWRGFEYDRWEGEVTVGGGEVTLAIPLHRAFAVGGALAADLHVHAARSNDSGLPDVRRVIAQAASGLQIVVLTDHASNGDVGAAIAELGLGDTMAAVAGNEAGNDAVHLGVYPVPVDAHAPRGGSPSPAEMARQTPAELIAWARGLATHPIVQVNHPRFRMYALFDTSGWDGVTWPPPFPLDVDAIEVLNGHNAFNDPRDPRIDQVVHDFYTFADHGVKVAAIGASDTHHLDGVLDGVARTYVLFDDARIAAFTPAALAAAVRDRRTIATTGPWLDVRISDSAGGPAAGPGQTVHAPSGRVRVTVSFAEANWVHADWIRILAGGRVVDTDHLADGQRRELTFDLAVPVPTWIGVDAGGDHPLPPEMTGTYQLEKGRAGTAPFAIISPIWIDPT